MLFYLLLKNIFMRLVKHTLTFIYFKFLPMLFICNKFIEITPPFFTWFESELNHGHTLQLLLACVLDVLSLYVVHG